MTTIRVGSGYTPPDNYFAQDDGTYPVTLTRIGTTDQEGAFQPFATRSYEGQYGLKVVQDWTFALENGEIIEVGVSAPKEKDGGLSIHPKSRYYGYVTALAGGKALAEGVEFDPEKHLIGRMALATIQRDEQGYPRVISLGAMPTQAAPQAAPAQQAAPQPLREAVAAQPDGLPF